MWVHGLVHRGGIKLQSRDAPATWQPVLNLGTRPSHVGLEIRLVAQLLQHHHWLHARPNSPRATPLGISIANARVLDIL